MITKNLIGIDALVLDILCENLRTVARPLTNTYWREMDRAKRFVKSDTFLELCSSVKLDGAWCRQELEKKIKQDFPE